MPATIPMTIAAHGYTVEQPAVMATNPARVELPIAMMSQWCLPVLSFSRRACTSNPVRPEAAGAREVVVAAFATAEARE